MWLLRVVKDSTPIEKNYKKGKEICELKIKLHLFIYLFIRNS